MGVKGLWRLLLPIGRRISIETLAGKTLAIDASIWLTQFLKAMRDPETGQANRSAHLIGFFRRICKLKFHRIRPVFVFDGATPEIKRAEVLRRKRKRDEFAERTTDASLQRLAKKLLTETLQKQKLSKLPQGGAFAAGFNPGRPVNESSNADKAVQLVSEKDTQRTNRTKLAIEDGKSDSELQQKESEVMLLEEFGGPNEPEQGTSDWDLPLQVAAEEEAREAEQNYKEEYDFSIEHVSSLPAMQRKDAIEKARRGQRMQSRKEFMPAAANPESFSSVQMKNFLNYCKLNQDIIKMAEQAAKKDNEGKIGEAMASDRATRVELIREDEDDEGPKSLLAVKLKAKKKARATKLNRFAHFEMSDDDEVNWEDTKDTATVSTFVGKRRVVDDDSSSDEDTPEGSLRPRRSDTGKLAAPEKKTSLTIDLDEHVENGPEGFTHVSVEINKIPVKKATNLDLLLVNSSDEESISDGDNNEGGFLRDDESSQVKRDAAMAQELQDRDLALALQNEQFEELIRHERDNSQTTATESRSPQHNGKMNYKEIIADESEGVEVVTGETHNPRDDNGDSSESTEDDVDWEDGEESCNKEGSDAFSSKQDANIEKCDPSVGNTKQRSSLDFGFAAVDSIDSSVEATRPGESPVEISGQKDSINQDPMSPEASAALIQAENTASNLTNWAGRAFRRAVREAGGSGKANERKEQRVEREAAKPVQTPTKINPKPSEPLGKGSTQHRSSHFGGPVPLAQNNSVDWFFLDNNLGADAMDTNRRERDMDTISDEMLMEVKQLLRLFGIPYVEAPAEAEAQCAVLEQLGLVDGIVTEDSDVFVFGGMHVYKNIFEEQKYAEAYVSSDAEKEMNLNRNAMVALAMLLGSDYTEGVKGVGIVNAMELLEAFDVTENLHEGLSAFRKWLDGFDPAAIMANATKVTETALTKEELFHRKHRSARTRWIAPQNFPSQEVMKAYLDPVVDNSTEPFSWGDPDYEKLKTLFCSQTIGWAPEDVKRLLEPVIEAQSSGPRQTRIDSYMRYQDSIRFADIKSKRLREVLEGINSREAPQDGKT